MTPVFHHTVVDHYGDQWANAVCRVSDYSIFKASEQRFVANDQDKFEQVALDENADEEPPYKILFSVEFWSKIQLKATGKESRQYQKGGNAVFEIDMNDPGAIQEWNKADGTYSDSITAVCIWFFKNKV